MTLSASSNIQARSFVSPHSLLLTLTLFPRETIGIITFITESIDFTVTHDERINTDNDNEAL